MGVLMFSKSIDTVNFAVKALVLSACLEPYKYIMKLCAECPCFYQFDCCIADKGKCLFIYIYVNMRYSYLYTTIATTTGTALDNFRIIVEWFGSITTFIFCLLSIIWIYFGITIATTMGIYEFLASTGFSLIITSNLMLLATCWWYRKRDQGNEW